MTDEQILAEVRRHANGCCMDDTWRGRACQYHQGYEDGLDRAQEEIVRLNEKILYLDDALNESYRQLNNLLEAS